MERRKRLIVDAGSQARMVRRITALPLVFLVFAAVAMTLTSSRVLDEVAAASVDLPSLESLLLTGLTFLLASGALTTYQALRYSHAVAGPTYRLQQSIARIRGGDLDFRINLRKGDELVALADELNLLIESLRAEQRAQGESRTVVSTEIPPAEIPVASGIRDA